MTDQELQRHIYSTYNSLRWGMIILAALTPVVVVLWGFCFNVKWQNSISAYYFANAADGDVVHPSYPVRVLFGGILFAVGAFLYLYKGFSRREDIALNVAGAAAVCVAMFPMCGQPDYIPFSRYVHFGSAVVLFACIGYTAIFCYKETLPLVADPSRRAWFRRTYVTIGWFMWVFPITGIVLAHLIDEVSQQVYWIEAAGIWAFAAYWFTKNRELTETEAEKKGLAGTFSKHRPETDPK